MSKSRSTFDINQIISTGGTSTTYNESGIRNNYLNQTSSGDAITKSGSSGSSNYSNYSNYSLDRNDRNDDNSVNSMNSTNNPMQQDAVYINSNNPSVIPQMQRGYMEQYRESNDKRRNELLTDVPTIITSSGRYEKAYTGFGDLSGGQLLKNKTQEIIDSCKRFNDVLREAESKRQVDLTADELEHLDANAIASSLKDVHAFVRENDAMRVNRNMNNKNGKR